MRVLLVFLLLAFENERSCSGSGPWPRGARSVAMGGVSGALGGDVWSASLNPALCATIQKSLLAIDYVPATFGLTELRRAGAALALPLGRTSLGIAGMQFGSELYRETWFSAGGAVRLGSDLCLGASLSLLSLSIHRYGSAAAVSLTIGGVLEPLPDLQCGWTVVNAAATRLGSSGERMAPAIIAGATTRLLDALLLSIDIWKEGRFPAEIHIGVEYSPLAIFSLRAGITHEPALYCAGFGVAVGPGRLDYGVSLHPVLGFTHTLTCSCVIGEL